MTTLDRKTTPTRDRVLGPATWIELDPGFPTDSWGQDRRAAVAGAEQPVLASADAGSFTMTHAVDLVAFTEFLIGAALPPSERDWLIDALAREFTAEPQKALAELSRIAAAVEAIPDLDPVERADRRHKALVGLYRTEPVRERLNLPETPVMAVLKAHNPALVLSEDGAVVTTDALDYRHRINAMILRVAGRGEEQLGMLQTELVDGFRDAGPLPQAELAGSQIRLVMLRTWLDDLPDDEFEELRRRLGQIVDTATDLDLVTMQLSFRALIEALGDHAD
jgi:hypothetical protein